MKTLLLSLLLAVTQAIAWGGEADEKLIRATYKLANETSTATCLVVSRQGKAEGAGPNRYLVTAHHVFDQMRGNTCVLVSRTARDDGTFHRKEITLEIRRKGRGNFWIKHPDHDLAILPLPADVVVEALPVACLATESVMKDVHSGDDLRLAVFPEQSEANGAGFAILRNGTIASYPLTPAKPHPIFLIDTTAWSGDSGGPIIHATQRAENGLPLVVGIVHGMRSLTDTVKDSRFTERKRHYPLGISEAMHASFLWEILPEAM